MVFWLLPFMELLGLQGHHYPGPGQDLCIQQGVICHLLCSHIIVCLLSLPSQKWGKDARPLVLGPGLLQGSPLEGQEVCLHIILPGHFLQTVAGPCGPCPAIPMAQLCKGLYLVHEFLQHSLILCGLIRQQVIGLLLQPHGLLLGSCLDPGSFLLGSSGLHQCFNHVLHLGDGVVMTHPGLHSRHRNPTSGTMCCKIANVDMVGPALFLVEGKYATLCPCSQEGGRGEKAGEGSGFAPHSEPQPLLTPAGF